MLRLLDDPISGNGYKVRLLLAFLELPYAYEPYNILLSETRTEAFLHINPNGRIPVLILEDGTALPESNAILNFLADGTSYLPTDRLQRAQVLQWMFFEQYSHEPNIATLRFWTHLPELDDVQRAQIPGKIANGKAALSLMNSHLSVNSWFVGDGPSFADIALFAYTHVAEDGGFDLSDYPAIMNWIDRIQQLAHFQPMQNAH